MSFEALKRNRTDLNKLVEAAQGTTQERAGFSDDRFWQPTRDKVGNGYAVIRFLPGSADSPTPWVRYWDHAFKGPTGQWYIEKSLTSIGQQDPIGEMNSKLWNEDGSNAAKTLVRERKRNLRYIANILVVADPTNPENEGQVKLYRFGKKIFDKIMDSMQPQFPDEKPVNPFDMWEGADFTLKIRKVEGYPNYDTSSFKSVAPLSQDDAHLEQIYNKQYDLSEWTDPKNFKSYNDLKARLHLVLGEQAPRTTKQSVALDDEVPFDRLDNKTASAPQYRTATATEPLTAASSMDDDDTMSYFAKLAAED
tara:strand:+ start:1804 stop:2727 length:924 start_codon:yes stop_codon:yes gene_type:complete